ncbi:MAG: addiction module protein [Gammaproteobacteria bacterium]|nr:addiction module protein [Gammaproteobacteria bacterium]
MSLPSKQLFNEALHLDEKERAELACLLIESLDMEVEEGVEAAWVVGIERRLEELDSGKVPGIPWENVMSQLLSNLDAQQS